MLKQVGFTDKAIKKKIESNELDKLSLIDPACGSGTFLYSAAGEIVKSFNLMTSESSQQIENIITGNIFGLDIEEFPLYLAEMSVLMRMLPLIISDKYNNPLDKKIKIFLTRDSISEFSGSGLGATEIDARIREAQLSYFGSRIQPVYPSYVRDEQDLADMKSSMTSIPRRRFDFVVGNPPYVSYNECAKQPVLIFESMKKGQAKLNNIYGVNLHSAPGRRKKYRPNPNLYAFFIALGIALLKEDGVMSYIVPQTFLVDPDYDVVRYHLSQYTTIEKIIIFSGKMFVGRGLRQDKPIITSSLIFVIKRQKPNLSYHQVEVTYYVNPLDEIDRCLRNISEGINIDRKNIPQAEFLDNIGSWGFIKQSSKFIDFRQVYQQNTQDISIYYDHGKAEKQFQSRFYFDGGYDFDERKALQSSNSVDIYEVLKFPETGYLVKGNKGFWPNNRSDGQKYQIKLRQANQGYNLLDSKYKVIWPYLRNIRFVFCDKPCIWSRRTTNTYYGIGSDNKKELLYLLSLLNSVVTSKMLSSFKLDSESKREIMISAALLKSEIRVPVVGSEDIFIKNEIIERADELLGLERLTLSDIVDFSGVLIQKYDSVEVDGDRLVLIHGSKRSRLPIHGDHKLVATTLAGKYGPAKLQLDESAIYLSELRNIELLDIKKHNRIKDYMDDLVFALYFKVGLGSSLIGAPKKIKAVCSTNKYYQFLLPNGD